MGVKLNPQSRGLLTWLWVRISAVAMLIYFVWVMALFFFPHSQQDWINHLHALPMRMMGMIALLGLLFHAGFGLWTVLTDYVKTQWMRRALEIITSIFLVACCVWGIILLGG
ncbi:MAG: succinate dehydrogenase, hydrophobic membrane anchor protein [Legionellales bacterium]|nr:succinate dehydrogenase, hydrophobic membrane anchor protein [Legionellales bacterium]|tara:strand:- start:222 stop:557 length:336 start_codon:yes stop_codon:yes gene_type:complete